MNIAASTLAATKLDDITRTKGAGRPVNTHVTPARTADKPDFERMKNLVHQPEMQPRPKVEKSRD